MKMVQNQMEQGFMFFNILRFNVLKKYSIIFYLHFVHANYVRIHSFDQVLEQYSF